MNNPKMVYTHDETGVEAQWSGGAYIDLGYTDGDGEFHASSTINVYDYAKGDTNIPFTTSAMKEAVDEYLIPDCEECDQPPDSTGRCVNSNCIKSEEYDEEYQEEEEP